jgi:hypothetical protein
MPTLQTVALAQRGNFPAPDLRERAAGKTVIGQLGGTFALT